MILPLLTDCLSNDVVPVKNIYDLWFITDPHTVTIWLKTATGDL